LAKVLVKLRSGEEIRGDLLSLAFNANLRTFYVHREADKEQTENVAVNMDTVKAVFFLKKGEEDNSIIHTETIEQSVFAGASGFRLHVEFADGEMIHGSSHKYNPNDKGFYLVPLNPGDRFERVYVNAAAVKSVDSRRLMGKILVDQKKVTPEQLGHALQYQQEKREKKIGTILRENDFITPEQLEESLRKQKERPKYLGQILLDAGYITEEQLNSALLIQQENKKKKLGQILVELKYITPNDICVAMATQFNLAWADLSSVNIPPGIATVLPEDVIRDLGIIPVEQVDDTLEVACSEPQEPGLVGVISRHTDLKIELVMAYEGYIEDSINRLFPIKD